MRIKEPLFVNFCKFNVRRSSKNTYNICTISNIFKLQLYLYEIKFKSNFILKKNPEN